MKTNEEVSIVEEERMESEIKEETGYQPRPKWQVWLARVGLVIFIAGVILYYIHIFRGGM